MPKTLRIFIFVIALFGVAPVASQAKQKIQSIDNAPAGIRLFDEKQMVPEIAFEDETGRNWGFVEFQDRVVIAIFWATWCPICFREMPKLDDLQAQYDEKKLLVVALSQDREGAEIVKRYYAKRGLKNLKVFIDPESIMAAVIGVRGVPTTFVIDRQGRMVGVVEGGLDWNSPDVKRFLGDLLS
ncbi:MAG: TlpA family protein disulfide reductase [Alphaproteobacteria bacterium]|nr:TlpA family protein disulfide reductase [Alphaproteobacteria bacterium]